MSYSDYRAQARASLQSNWGICIVVALITSILGGLHIGNYTSVDLETLQSLGIPVKFLSSTLLLSVTANAMNIIRFIFGGPVQLGYSRFLLRRQNGESVGIDELFSQFHRFLDGFCLQLLRHLFVTLWGLLLIIPGIIANYSYAMAPFIMTENEGMTAREALRASKEMMQGHKAELFTLELTFFGWIILSLLTMGIGFIFLVPYMNAAYAAFYKDISRQEKVETF